MRNTVKDALREDSRVGRHDADHGVEVSAARMVVGHAEPAEELAHAQGVDALERTRSLALEEVEDVGGREPFDAVGRGVGGEGEVFHKGFFQGRLAVEEGVVGFDGSFFVLGEGVGLTLAHFGQKLGVELGMVGPDGADVAVHHLAIEAAGAGGVGEEGIEVARADEGGHAGADEAAATVGAAHDGLGELHEVFQCAHLALAVAVELVHVDECQGGKASLGVAVGGEVELVGVVAAEFGREWGAAEGALAESLALTDEQRGHLVVEGAGGCAFVEPGGHHGAHPAVEHPLPLRVGADLCGHFGHAVVPVPGGKLREVVAQGMVRLDGGGEEETVDPAAVAEGEFVLHGHHEGVVAAFVEGEEGDLGLVGGTEFDVVVELVVTQVPARLDDLADARGRDGVVAAGGAGLCGFTRTLRERGGLGGSGRCGLFPLGDGLLLWSDGLLLLGGTLRALGGGHQRCETGLEAAEEVAPEEGKDLFHDK